jgi:hypothetical protein
MLHGKVVSKIEHRFHYDKHLIKHIKQIISDEGMRLQRRDYKGIDCRVEEEKES